METKITDTIAYIGADDTTLDLFEGQYDVPEGVSYNSYVILDEKTAVMDTVDKRCISQWETNLLKALNGRKADYLILHHLEPDHAGSVQKILELFPDIIIVGNAKTFQMFPQFFQSDISNQTFVVKEGDTLCLGAHTLSFFMAPMVHWPEVMVSYDSKDRVLFSADGFGKFGALELTKEHDWACEARRYYFNIVGKYGAAVQGLLKKVEKLDLAIICPLHGPVLTGDLTPYVQLYKTWSSYEPEASGVLIAYCSFHGNTAFAAKKLEELLSEKGVKNIALYDLARADMSEVIEAAFQYDRMVVAAPSYDGNIFPAMQDFLYHLQIKAYQNRTAAIIENGSWAPSAGKIMHSMLSAMKNITILEPLITIRSVMKEEDLKELQTLAEHLINASF